MATEMSDEPPDENSGIGMPVAGAKPEATITFSKSWNER
jgi:hypothetical protein